MTKGYYYGYEWTSGKVKGPFEGRFDETKVYWDGKVYFSISGLPVEYKVYYKPGLVNVSRVYNLWLEEPDNEKAKELLLKELQKRKDSYEQKAKMLEKSIEMLSNWSSD